MIENKVARIMEIQLSVETVKGSGVFKVIGTSTCDMNVKFDSSEQSHDWEDRFGHLDCFNPNLEVIDC
jgi:hypothetical protein